MRPPRPDGRGNGETYKEFKERKDMARGERPKNRRQTPNPESWGMLTAEQVADAVLMEREGKGEQYIPKEAVEKKKKQGYVVVGGEEVPDVRTEPVKRGPGRPKKE